MAFHSFPLSPSLLASCAAEGEHHPRGVPRNSFSSASAFRLHKAMRQLLGLEFRDTRASHDLAFLNQDGVIVRPQLRQLLR